MICLPTRPRERKVEQTQPSDGAASSGLGHLDAIARHRRTRHGVTRTMAQQSDTIQDGSPVNVEPTSRSQPQSRVQSQPQSAHSSRHQTKLNLPQLTAMPKAPKIQERQIQRAKLRGAIQKAEAEKSTSSKAVESGNNAQPHGNGSADLDLDDQDLALELARIHDQEQEETRKQRQREHEASNRVVKRIRDEELEAFEDAELAAALQKSL